MKTTTIRQTVTFAAAPEKIYHLIMDQKKHAAFTGTNVIMSTKVNGKFNIFDGYCRGYNIELIKGKKIIQAWHFEEEGWPDDHFSTCIFQFMHLGNKTKLTFRQTGVPEQSAESLKAGWKQYYWEPMKAALERS
ncbi:MAG: SRPBCC domain-containing protein [Bacteroidales bacterium]|jgi:activator of HSP90 ATPase|nr:SRPBCC domain-containing protein [Bacteroidales bacterium]